MATGLLLDKRLSGRTLRDSRIVVDEAACTGATFTTLLNPDGDGKNYRLGTWTVSGLMSVLAPGEAEVFCLSGGGAGNTYGGNGGRPIHGFWRLPAGLLPVVVGAGAPGGTDSGAGQMSGYSSLNAPQIVAGAAGSGWNYVQGARSSYPAGGNYKDAYPCSITGVSIDYGRAGESGFSAPIANRGMGSLPGGAGSTGVVHVRWEI